MERDFKGVWIPKNIWLNSELKVMEKLFLVEIDSLDNQDGCYATNDYFSTFFKLSKNRCSEIIKSLEKKGHISIEYKYKQDSKAIEKRVIRLLEKSFKPIRIIDRPTRKTEEGYSEKCEENNTIINNTINNNIYSLVIKYLNEKAGTKYTVKSAKTKTLIRARMGEGFEEEDFIQVIDNKVEEWKNTEMEKYLRPETLFGTKFEGYLNQKGVILSGGNWERNNRQGIGKDISTSTNKFAGFRAPKIEYNFTEEEQRRIKEELI